MEWLHNSEENRIKEGLVEFVNVSFPIGTEPNPAEFYL